MIYQFYSQRIVSDRKPVCPKCGDKNLERLLSAFNPRTGSKSQARPETEASAGVDAPREKDGGPLGDDPFAGMSPEQQARSEREMMKLMSDAERLDENDPRQMGHMMERMMQIVGQDKNKEMQEAIRRLKAGEDPEKIEAEMGDVLGLGEGGEDEESGGSPYGGYGQDGGLYDY
jgi:hypothetical protein